MQLALLLRGRTNSAVLRSGEALWMVLPSIQESFAACAASAGFSVHLRLPVAWVAGAWCRGSRQQGGLPLAHSLVNVGASKPFASEVV